PFLHLLPDVVHLINGIMGLGELVTNLYGQGELGFRAGLAHADAWIRANVAGGGALLVFQAEFDLIRSWRCQRAGQTALGGNVAWNGVCIRVAHVPHEAVEPRSARHTRLAGGLGRWRSVGWLARKALDELPLGIAKAQGHGGRWLLAQVVRDHDASGWILAGI